MTTAIGPQSANFSTTRPALDPVVSSGAADTWCVNCSTPGATDGTYLDADFFNVIIAQLRTAIRNGGIALTNADDYMLWEAIAVMALRYGFTVNTGTPDTAIATLTTPSGSGNPMPGGYVYGTKLVIEYPAPNTTTAPTINVNGYGALPVLQTGGFPILAGQLFGPVSMVCLSTYFGVDSATPLTVTLTDAFGVTLGHTAA